MRTVDELSAELSKLEKGYELLGELSRDDTVTVYVARDRLSGNEVTIKVLRASDARGREGLAHYASDARLLTALEHPNIVAVHAVKWLSENVVAVITERVRGPSLRQVLDVAGTLPVARATEVLKGLGRALAWAHSSQIMHRDVRPENVIFEDRTGRVVLSDFGLARRIESLPGAGVADAYRAPELADGRYPDRRSDVYSLGIVGWELLTGRRPWPDTMEPVAPGEPAPAPPPLAAVRPGLPAALVSAIEGAVQLDRDRRIPDVTTFLERLTGVAPPPRLRPRQDEEQAHARSIAPSEWVALPVPKMPPRPAAPTGAAGAGLEGERETARDLEREVPAPLADERASEPAAVPVAPVSPVASEAPVQTGALEAPAQPETTAEARPEAKGETQPKTQEDTPGRREREVARVSERDVEATPPRPAPPARPAAAAALGAAAVETIASHGAPPAAPVSPPPADATPRRPQKADAAHAGPTSTSAEPTQQPAAASGAAPEARTMAASRPAEPPARTEPPRERHVETAPGADGGRDTPDQTRGPQRRPARADSAPVEGRAGTVPQAAVPTEKPVRGGEARARVGEAPSSRERAGSRPERAGAGETGAAAAGGAAAAPAADAPPPDVVSPGPPKAADVDWGPFQGVQGESRGPLRGPVHGPVRGSLAGPASGPTARPGIRPPERMRGGLGVPQPPRGDAPRSDPLRAQPLPGALDPVFDTPAEFPLPVMPDPRPVPADVTVGGPRVARSRWRRRGVGIAAAVALLAVGAVVIARMERGPDTLAGLMEPETPAGYGGDVDVKAPPVDSVGLTTAASGRAATAPSARGASAPSGVALRGGGAPSGGTPPAARQPGAQPSGPAAAPPATRPGAPTARAAAPAAIPATRPGTSLPPEPRTTSPARTSVPPRTTRSATATGAGATTAAGATAAATRTAATGTPSPAVSPARTWDERAEGFARCNSPALADQRACIAAHLARNDAGLNQVYNDVIAAMRRRANTAPGDPDPPEVQRLRAAQRNWLVRRDTECRQRGRGREGPLWATQRARCLEELSLARGRELSNTLARLRQD